MAFLIFIIAVTVLCCYTVLARLAMLPHDSEKEPPLIPQRIPICGHLVGMLRHGTKYYSGITQKFQFPIYTLSLPKAKLYIVNSPQLVSLIDRHARIISFAPFVVQFAKRIMIPSVEAVEKLSKDLLEEESEPCLRQETFEVMHKALATGEGLERAIKVAVESLAHLLNGLAGDGEASSTGKEVRLFEWVRGTVTVSSTDAVYGPRWNPFRERDVQDAFWAIDNDFALLGLGVLPSIVAPKGSKARTRFFKAMKKYYRSGGQAEASEVVQARYETNRKHGISDDDIAHFDLAVCYGTLVNTVPGTSWALYYLFSNTELLVTVRDMVAAAAEELAFQGTGSDSALRKLNIAAVIARCPLLTSLVKETLRVQSTNAAARIVLKDTLLDGRYLLKEGALLFIPSEDMHGNETVWGPTAKTFDAGRFLDEKRGASKVPAAAYRAFGSGASVCPGRFFALNEIVSILVIMVLKYDVKPVGGQWVIPKSVPHITKSILTPGEDIRVVLTEREAAQGVAWGFYWDSSEVSKNASL